MEDILKSKEQVEEINIIGNAMKGVDDKAKALIQANLNGVITGLRMGIELTGDSHGV
jgi:hypothetical protein